MKSLPGYVRAPVHRQRVHRRDGLRPAIDRRDKNVKVINTRNFGHIQSPQHALLRQKGVAVTLAADLQTPFPIPFVHEVEAATRSSWGSSRRAENWVLFHLRKAYYNFLARIANIKLVKNFTGFGLTIARSSKPCERSTTLVYFRGLVADLVEAAVARTSASAA
jgi:hypothetical protein